MRQLILAAATLLFATTNAEARNYLFAQPNASSTPSISISESAVRVEGITPGGDVILLGASLRNEGGFLRQSTGMKAFSDTGGSGVITYTPSRPIALRSIWLAVDLETGRYFLGTPANYIPQTIPFPTTLLRSDADGIIDLFGREQLTAEVLIVRPRFGAWRLRAFDGGAGDSDRTRNGRLTLTFSEAVVIHGSPTPHRLKAGDVVAIIDPGRMEVCVTEIAK